MSERIAQVEHKHRRDRTTSCLVSASEIRPERTQAQNDCLLRHFLCWCFQVYFAAKFFIYL